MTHGDVYAIIDELAPFDTQDSFDNAGFLVGDRNTELTGVLVSLDATMEAVDAAIQCGANLVVTHHPLMFSAIHTLTAEDHEAQVIAKMIRHGISLISAHTNLDKAKNGTNETLLKVLGAEQTGGEGYLRIGKLPEDTLLSELIRRAEKELDTVVRVGGDAVKDRTVRTLAVSTGAGSEGVMEAAAMGADVFMTGEMKHHHQIFAKAKGIATLECGHLETEEPGIFALADALQTRLSALQYTGCVTKHRVSRCLR